MGKSNSLDEIISQLKRPLEFASKNSFANLSHLRDLESTINSLIDRAVSFLSHQSSAVSNQQNLIKIKDLFSGFDLLSLNEKKERLKTAQNLLESLRVKEFKSLGVNSITPQLHNSSTSIQFVKGVGEKRAKLLSKLNIQTIEDALYFIPMRYEDRSRMKKISEIRPVPAGLKQGTGGGIETIAGTILSRGVIKTKWGKRLFEVAIKDETGLMRGKWFKFNEKYMNKKFSIGQKIIMSGEVQFNPYQGGIEIIHPDIETLEDSELQTGASELLHVGRIVPIYHLTEGIHQKTLRVIMKEAVDSYADYIVDFLPEGIKKEQRLLPLKESIKNIHFPEKGAPIEKLNTYLTDYHRRLIFDEFFLLELGLAIRKRGWQEEKKGVSFKVDGNLTDKLRSILPFKLTQAQERVINEIKRDLAKPEPMNRLLQGDVGSGKTVVALYTMLIVVENGYQTAIMAPTEILSEQHFLNIHKFVEQLGLRTALLTSSVKGKEREEILTQLSNGDINIIVGTHALIQEGVRFKNLGFAIIDEQHRFGVIQRGTIKNKGYSPDILVMTATPIPRTLSMTVYGDLELSVIDEMPPGRKPINTLLFFENRIKDAYTLIEREINARRQAYIVYPLIEESEKLDLKAATEMMEHFKRDIFPHLKIGLLHGRMKSDEKEDIMRRFKEREIDILVSTTVIEVGVDVPNASVMVVEHSERFGLSQLHQLRGRVGRGEYQSYCILIAYYPISEEAKMRLKVMRESIDGFYIAEKDLEIRGPGEFFGTRQSGLPELKIANIIRDYKLLESARDEAFKLIEIDPSLSASEHQLLKDSLKKRWQKRLELGEIG
ncbi:MAG: ATP-dependent DNA helicase RecG [Nitrospinae bacterium]|nr:ATP-dependent DNA helicase RecG [Nitrospinota bacterium]